jgi:hypothetical protein
MPTFPVIAKRTGLAARYNVDPAGQVFVLDATHRIDRNRTPWGLISSKPYIKR